MSVSGAGLYDDDAAWDARSIFRDAVADGATTEEATRLTIAEWGDLLDDPDQGCPFWLALADTQSRTGRLLDEVRDRALGIITSGADLARFEHESRLHQKRAVVLAELAERLAAPQRAPTRIRRPFRSVSPVAAGDIFAYRLPDERVAYLRCAAVVDMGGSTSPVVEVLSWTGSEPPPDPLTLTTTRPRRPGSPRLGLFRRSSRVPDPGSRIAVLTSDAAHTARDQGFTVVEWSDLGDVLDRWFW